MSRQIQPEPFDLFPDDMTGRLLSWYGKNARQLPWRLRPGALTAGQRPDPYHVWLSEIMLQQTQVVTVKAYFLKFLQLWPDIFALAAAHDDDVMAAWAGLGYYSRARNLKKCADITAGELKGEFPDNVEALKQLPGIGEYTAAAIAAIAFNRPAVVVDGNVERVIARLYAIKTRLPAAKAEIRQKTAALVPDDHSGDFAQAMMDLGATICTPKNPNCQNCPLNRDCQALTKGVAEILPNRQKKLPKPQRKGAAFVIRNCHDQIWLQKRPVQKGAGGMLAGMAQIPTSDWSAKRDGKTGLAAAPFAGDWQYCDTVRHTFTHFHLTLEIWQINVEEICGLQGWWVELAGLEAEALPSLMKKAIIQALPEALKSAPKRVAK